jgi:hypothetical protein
VLIPITPASSDDLTTVARARAELQRCQKDDDWLRENITLVSLAIAEHLERPLTRRVVEQRLSGGGTTTVVLDLTPVVGLTSVQGIGYSEPEDLTDGRLAVSNGPAGIIWRMNGWPDDSPWSTGLTDDRRPMQGQETWTVRYTGGWLTAADDLSGLDATTAADGTITLPAGRTAPLLVPGDQIRLQGFGLASGSYVVAARTASTIQVSGTLPVATGDAGSWILVRNLPGTLERLVFDTLQGWASKRGRDTDVTSERIGDWAATYGSREMAIDEQASSVLPRAVLNGLRQWKRVI